jgi:hypothetical protein
VLLEEPLGRRQDPVGDSFQPGVAVDQLPAELAAEPVADVVPDDRGRRGDDDHGRDRQLSLRRVDAGGYQSGLAGKPEACGFQADDGEEEPEPVVDDEMGHARPGYVGT